MRAAYLLGLLVVLLAPAVATAQPAQAQAPTTATPPAATAPAPAAHPAARRGGDITRDEYVARAVERARRAAERRFDAMDTDHDGVLTAAERRAYREARRANAAPVQPAPPKSQ
jgi:hypothetical protein